MELTCRTWLRDTYQIRIIPDAPLTGTLAVTLQPGVTGNLAANSNTSTISTAAPGQLAYKTLNLTAGQSLSIAITDIVLSPDVQPGMSVVLYSPSGQYYTSWSCDERAPTGCEESLFNIPVTGTYQLVFEPNDARQTLSFSILISRDANAAFSLGSPATVNLPTLGESRDLDLHRDGQSNHGAYGERINTNPAGGYLFFQLYNSAGQIMLNTNANADFTWNLANLPADTYQLRILPDAPLTGTLHVALQPGVTGSLAVDSSTSSIATVAPGQLAYKSLNLTCGTELRHRHQQHRVESRMCSRE